MQVPLAPMTEGRAATLRSAQLLQHTAAVEVVLALVLLPQVSVDAEAASVQRVQPQVQQHNTAAVVVVTAALLLVSVP